MGPQSDMLDNVSSVKVRDIKPGDIIDLAGDQYADPNHDNVTYEYEYAVVGGVIHETPDCIVLCIEGVDHIGFPPDHLVMLAGHDNGYETE
jgi:hypothetical protein